VSAKRPSSRGPEGQPGPTRTCVGCGARDAQAAMVRLRRGPDGIAIAAPRGGTGRSAYVHAGAACIGGLARSKGFGRSLRVTVTKETRLDLMRILDERLAAGGWTIDQAGHNAGTAPGTRREISSPRRTHGSR